MDGNGILWLTRGVSFGHAARDVMILQALEAVRPDLRIRLVSYGNGCSLLREHGLEVVPFGRPYGWLHLMSGSELSVWFRETAGEFMRTIRAQRPRLVVADEEFPASIAADRCGIPCVLISDKVPGELSGKLAELVRASWDRFSAILIPDDCELFESRHLVAGDAKVRFVGPVIRFPPSLPSRAETRQALGIPPDTVSILVANGGNSETTRIFELAGEVAESPRGNRWSWTFAGPYAQARAGNVAVRRLLGWDFLLHLHACDAVVTGAGLSTLNEVLCLGVPGVIFPQRVVYQQRDARRIHCEQGLILDLESCSGDRLVEAIHSVLARPRRTLPDRSAAVRPAFAAAEAISEILAGIGQ